MLATTEVDRVCAEKLIETDRRYFELGAQIETLSIGQLAWMPDLTDLAACCVVHRVDFASDQAVSGAWIDEIERALQERSVARARVYLDDCPEQIGSLFSQRNYARRGEVGFLAPIGHPTPPKNVRLCEVVDENDWQLKKSIHEESMDGPDGYTNQADLWVEMERRKCASGGMKSFLVRRNAEVVATVGAIVNDGLLRLKNIVVSPQFRRMGLAVATVQLLWQMAEADHGCRLGVFGVEGGRGDQLYSRAGLYRVTRQYEWSRLMIGSP